MDQQIEEDLRMLYDLLYPWQKKLVDTVKERKSYGLFLDMGLGKTPISLALCEANDVDKILIITLNSKACETEKNNGSWAYWALKMKRHYKISTKKDESFDEPETCYIINYERLGKTLPGQEGKKKWNKAIDLMPAMKQFLASCKGKKLGIIIDESHKMKDTASLQTKSIMQIYKVARMLCTDTRLYLLTGTPFTQGYIDLYSQLKILGFPMTKTAFEENFCIRGNKRGLAQWQQPIVGYRNVSELLHIVHQYAITIETKEVIELPEQTSVYHSYPMTEEFEFFITKEMKGIRIAKELKKRNLEDKEGYAVMRSKTNNPFFRNIDYPGFDWTAETPGQFWLRSRELSIGFQGNSESYCVYDETRFNMLKDFLKEHEDNYLLFYSYTPELIKIYDICTELGYKIDIYSGEIKSLVNYNAYASEPMEKRMFEPRKNIIISNWQSGSTGMNFQAYSKCIIFDLPVYRDWEQGLKRIHRTGQKNTCIYHVFFQDNFLDHGMMDAIKERKEYTKDTFQSDLDRVQEMLGK